MARGIARVTLVGRLVQDPELRQTAGGTAVCQLRVVVNSSAKDASGQWVEKPSFFDVVTYGNQAENCARYLSKGRQVAVDGRLDQRSWEAQDGSKRSKVEIVADYVEFVGSQTGETREPVYRDRGQAGGNQASGNQAAPDTDTQDDFRDIDFGGDDIPF